VTPALQALGLVLALGSVVGAVVLAAHGLYAPSFLCVAGAVIAARAAS
jgi:hypothetical protein